MKNPSLFSLFFHLFTGLILINNTAIANCPVWQEVAANLTPRNELRVNWRIVETLTTQIYRVERSTDKVKFETIGELSGLQQLDGEIRYSWDDKNPLLGTIYYRIRQIKTTGEECLSPTLEFTYVDSGIQRAEMFPNPCTDYLHLTFYASKYSELSLVFVNDTGVLMRSQTVKVSLGFNSLLISTEGLPTGLYTIDLRNKELAVRRRLLILEN